MTYASVKIHRHEIRILEYNSYPILMEINSWKFTHDWPHQNWAIQNSIFIHFMTNIFRFKKPQCLWRHYIAVLKLLHSLCFKSNIVKKRLVSLFENVLVVALRVGEYITCKYDNCNHDMNFHHHCGNYCKSSSRNYQHFL